ncbi:MAG: hypothetical protein KF875_12930 [Trueperaceae bacterium]|nr:hypothetical protein [Trueperaceae bacterium]MCC6311228.1 hypothetical protein [Trueperaceae bacterium]MCO5174871.1 hypothetical protein [Trueperaceae bacterium]
MASLRRNLTLTLLLALPALGFAQRPLAALLPQSTVLAVELRPAGLDPDVLHSLFADLDTSEAESVWEGLAGLLYAADGGGMTELRRGHGAMRDVMFEECPDLSKALFESDAGSWSAAAGVSVSRFAPKPELLLAVRGATRSAAARLLAGAVACFDGRRYGVEGSSAIYLVGDGGDSPALLAESGGVLLVATEPELLRGAVRRSTGATEPSFLDTRIASAAQELGQMGLKATVNLAALADTMRLVRGAVPPEAAGLFERLVTTLRIVGGFSWGLTLDGGGVLVRTASAWDEALAKASGEDALLALLECEGCRVGQPPLLPESTVAVEAGAFPLAAFVDWLDSWLSDVAATGAFAAGEPTDVRGAAAAFLGLDLGEALLDWSDGSAYFLTLGVLDTDLRNWVTGLPSVTVVPATSEDAAWRGVRSWLEAAERFNSLLVSTSRAEEFAGALEFSQAVSVRELQHAGVEYLRVRSGPTLDVGLAVFDGNLVIGSPTAALLQAIDSRSAPVARPAALAPGLIGLTRAPGALVGYSLVDSRSFLRGLAQVAELASAPTATLLWLAGHALTETRAGAWLGDAQVPTYDQVLVLTDLAVAAMRTLADSTETATGTVTVLDGARWSSWRLPLGAGAR